MTGRPVIVLLVDGVEGPSVYIDDTRIAARAQRVLAVLARRAIARVDAHRARRHARLKRAHLRARTAHVAARERRGAALAAGAHPAVAAPRPVGAGGRILDERRAVGGRTVVRPVRGGILSTIARREAPVVLAAAARRRDRGGERHAQRGAESARSEIAHRSIVLPRALQ